MDRNRRRPIILLAVVLALAACGPARAQVTLHFAPPDQTLQAGETGVLSVVLDEPFDLRTVELRVTYDDTLLGSLDGGPGDLFTATGCELFTDFDDAVAGEWYGAAVILGHDCWATGPGELYRWTFEALDAGTSPVAAVEVVLYDPQANPVQGNTLPPTTVVVETDVGVPAWPPGPTRLELYPNPFNPATRLRFSSARPGPARLEVYDLAGQCLGTAWQGRLGADPLSVRWEGRDGTGRPLANGVYVFRLRCASGETRVARGVLLK
jgi:hypothetical protein